MNNKFITSINDFIKKYHLYAFKDVAIFMIIILFFHVLWKIFISDVVAHEFYQNSTDFLARKVYNASVWFLQAINIDISTFDELSIGDRLRKNVIFYAANNGFVAVGQSCSGLKQFYQWVFLMLLYPGPWKHKLWFIPFGLLIIHIVNIFRIITMTFVTINIPQHWDFTHDWIMRPFFYVVMFALWVQWNEKFYLKNKELKANKKKADQ
ncbi:MAG: hypothetical protein B6D61_10290 [Bacteroidetes bacterium 4484_249]|nr:MAG: hypothetical protein B6D61_10290 [Bacteroidetes bacterium 4484_249]